MRKKYYNMAQTGKKADIMIFGDITSWRWMENDVSAFSFANELDSFGELDEIVVHINSYGGEVAEGFAVYNTLKNHPAKVTTVCDGFACSAASVIFMAGDRRIMNPLSALWVHNVQSGGRGDYNALRKAADESEQLTELSRKAYRANINISDEELDAMMTAETWIMPDQALSMGFATEVNSDDEDDMPEQSGKESLFRLITNALNTADHNPGEPNLPAPAEPDKGDPTPGDPEDKTENAVQKMCGFFNAIIKMSEQEEQ